MSSLDDIVKYGKELVFLKLKEVAGWVVSVILLVILIIVLIATVVNKTEDEIKCDVGDTNVTKIDEEL